MDNPLFVLPPEELKFELRSYSAEELMVLLGCKRTTFFKYAKKFRPYFGAPVRKMYFFEMVLILILYTNPSNSRATHVIMWMESVGYDRYLIKRFKLEAMFPRFQSIIE
jgi:hypothetical protein